MNSPIGHLLLRKEEWGYIKKIFINSIAYNIKRDYLGFFKQENYLYVLKSSILSTI
jgi:hypothetical protein